MSQTLGKLYVCHEDFNAESESELFVFKNDLVHVGADGIQGEWYYGTCLASEQEGYFSPSFVTQVVPRFDKAILSLNGVKLGYLTSNYEVGTVKFYERETVIHINNASPSMMKVMKLDGKDGVIPVKYFSEYSLKSSELIFRMFGVSPTNAQNDVTSKQGSSVQVLTPMAVTTSAAFDFTAENSSECSLSSGQKVSLVSSTNYDWVTVRCGVKSGLAPTNFLVHPSNCDYAVRVTADYTDPTNGVEFKENQVIAVKWYDNDWLSVVMASLDAPDCYFPLNYTQNLAFYQDESESGGNVQVQNFPEPTVQSAHVPATVDWSATDTLASVSPNKTRHNDFVSPPAAPGSDAGSVSSATSSQIVASRGATSNDNVSTLEQAITEMVTTEQNYVDCMTTCLSVISEDGLLPPAPSGLDKPKLIANLSEVVSAATNFFNDLRNELYSGGAPSDFSEATPKAIGNVMMGQVFVRHKQSIEVAYAAYCTQLDSVLQVLENVSTARHSSPNSEFFVAPPIDHSTTDSDWAKQATVMIESQSGIAEFSLQAILTKPLQRLTRYPLLLTNILKHFPSGHSDMQNVCLAAQLYSGINTVLNEKKRQSDLVKMYIRQAPCSAVPGSEDDGPTRGGGGLKHSLMKATGRLTYRLKASVGAAGAGQSADVLVAPVVSTNGDTAASHPTSEAAQADVETQFVNVTRKLFAFTDQIKDHRDDLSSWLAAETGVTETVQQAFDSSHPATRAYIQVSSEIGDSLRETIANMDSQIMAPLGQMRQLSSIPRHLITKRDNKLVDYRRFLSAAESAKTLPQNAARFMTETNVAKSEYQALATSLIKDLPRFNAACLSLVKHCIERFIALKHELSTRIVAAFNATPAGFDSTMQTKTVMGVRFDYATRLFMPEPPIKSGPVSLASGRLGGSITSLDQVENSVRANSPRPPVQATEVSTASNHELAQTLRAKYDPALLYEVTIANVAANSSQISVQRGQTVAVLKTSSPDGTRGVWAVDTGVKKGFVPSSILRQVLAATVPSVAPRANPAVNNLLDFDFDPLSSAPPPSTSAPIPPVPTRSSANDPFAALRALEPSPVDRKMTASPSFPVSFVSSTSPSLAPPPAPRTRGSVQINPHPLPHLPASNFDPFSSSQPPVDKAIDPFSIAQPPPSNPFIVQPAAPLATNDPFETFSQQRSTMSSAKGSAFGSMPSGFATNVPTKSAWVPFEGAKPPPQESFYARAPLQQPQFVSLAPPNNNSMTTNKSMQQQQPNKKVNTLNLIDFD